MDTLNHNQVETLEDIINVYENIKLTPLFENICLNLRIKPTKKYYRYTYSLYKNISLRVLKYALKHNVCIQ